MYLFAIIFGIGLGGEYLIIPLIAAELFGVKALGRLMGIIVTVDGVAEALLPFAIADFRDRMGNYRLGFITLIVIALVGAVAVSLLPGRPGSQTGVLAPVGPATSNS
jgi:nitrate/nitrite transporter NarK